MLCLVMIVQDHRGGSFGTLDASAGMVLVSNTKRGIEGTAAQWDALYKEPKRAQWKQESKLNNTQTTDRFVSRFTLHRGYRTINLNNVTYKM